MYLPLSTSFSQGQEDRHWVRKISPTLRKPSCPLHIFPNPGEPQFLHLGFSAPSAFPWSHPRKYLHRPWLWAPWGQGPGPTYIISNFQVGGVQEIFIENNLFLLTTEWAASHDHFQWRRVDHEPLSIPLEPEGLFLAMFVLTNLVCLTYFFMGTGVNVC